MEQAVACCETEKRVILGFAQAEVERDRGRRTPTTWNLERAQEVIKQRLEEAGAGEKSREDLLRLVKLALAMYESMRTEQG